MKLIFDIIVFLLVPLYRQPQPTLTVEERELLIEYLPTLDETARNLALMSEPYNEAAILYTKRAATLRSLLQRLGGTNE